MLVCMDISVVEEIGIILTHKDKDCELAWEKRKGEHVIDFIEEFCLVDA